MMKKKKPVLDEREMLDMYRVEHFGLWLVYGLLCASILLQLLMGAEMMQPMAVVSIGGLTYSTLMTLFIVPVLYDLFNGKKLKAREVMMMKEAAGLLGDEILEGDSVTDSADGSTVSASAPAEPSAAAPIMPAVPEVPTEPAAPAAVPAPAVKPDFSLPPVKPAVPPKKGAVKVRLKTK